MKAAETPKSAPNDQASDAVFYRSVLWQWVIFVVLMFFFDSLLDYAETSLAEAFSAQQALKRLAACSLAGGFGSLALIGIRHYEKRRQQ
jgi:nitrate reductase gamma subunit